MNSKMAFTGNPVSPAGSHPQVVSLPQIQRIVQDVVDCVHQLKEDFNMSKSPITDDSQVLQRFCAKLEYLMQFEMKERLTLLGKRKDYWEYFCDCLASNKGANDGIKYVKALGEHKTSVGKGRAFIRFSLVHQRLADTLQQCAIHSKTGEWYHAGSVWLRPEISSSVINTLYDLNGLHFDLSPRGYDLDNAWPSFARNVGAVGNWNVPSSRRSSITSMDTLSLMSTDPSELSRLQQELVSAETARSVLAENVTALEQERQRAEQSVWMTQGELSALQDQLKSTGKKQEELQRKYSALELSHTQLQAEKAEQGKEVDQRLAQLSTQQQLLSQEKEQLAQQLEKERAHFVGEIQTLRQNLIEAIDVRDKLGSRVSSLEESVEQAKAWDAKKDQQICRLEQQASALEQRNKELLEEVSRNLSLREQDASSQVGLAQKFQDLASRLKEAESENMRLQGTLIDLTHKCSVSQKAVEEEQANKDALDKKLEVENKKSESFLSELKSLRTELEKERSAGSETVEKLEAQIAQVKAEMERAKGELGSATETLLSTQYRQSDLMKFLTQLMQAALEASSAGDAQTPDISSCSQSDLAQFVQMCQQSLVSRHSDLQSRLEAAEKQMASLSAERDAMQQTLDAVVDSLPDKPENCSKEMMQQADEVESRVKWLCQQLSDMTTNNAFLQEQLHLAQGEKSDKGNQLSHLQGRLLELEKALKELQASENSLQGQVASKDMTLKTVQQQNSDLQSQLQAATAEVSARTQTLTDLEQEKVSLEQQSRELQAHVAELQTSLSAAAEQADEKRENEEKLNARAEELASELEGTRRALEDMRQQLYQVQDKVREGEETVEKFLATMDSLETDKASMETEQDSLQQQLTEAISQLTAAVSDREKQKSDIERLQADVEQLSKQCSAMKEQLGSRDVEVKSLQMSLQNTVQEHTKVVEEQRSQLKHVEAELKQAKIQTEETMSRILQETSLRESAEAERDCTTQKLELVSSELKEKEVTFAEQIQSLRVQLEMYQSEKEELRQSSSSSHEEMTRLLTEKQDLVSSLLQEKTAMEKRATSITEQKQVVEADVARLVAELEEVKKAVENDKTKLKQDCQQTQCSLQQCISEMTIELEQAKRDLTSRMEEIIEVREQIEVARNESERLRSNSASEKSELEDSLEKLHSRFSELQTAMDLILREKEDLAALQAASQEEILELKADLASSSDGYSFLLQSSQKVEEEKDSELEALRSQLAELERAKQELEAEVHKISCENKALEDKLGGLQSCSQTFKSKEQELEQALAERSKEVEELREKVNNLNSSISVLEDDDRARREEVTQLEKTLQERESAYSTQVESLEQEVSALQFQLSSEQLQHDEFLRAEHESSSTEMAGQLVEQQLQRGHDSWQSSSTEIPGQLTEQQLQIAELETELSAQLQQYETERTNLNQQMEELRSELKAKEKECRDLAEQHQKKENTALHLSLDRDIEEREEEICTLRSDNEQLKKQLVRAIRDKAALWQQTDALAYEHKRKAGGRWIDSSTVIKCMGCHADFSLFLRKHHCRLCGGIFCHNCSDNWVDSASSSSKSRACIQCYSDLQKLDASIAKASLLPDDSDDDSGNVGTDAVISQQGSQRESQSQSSLLQERSHQTSNNEDDHSSAVSSGDDVYTRTSSSPDPTEQTCTTPTTTAPSEVSVLESESSQDSTFQVITKDEVTKSIAAYDQESATGPQSLTDVPNMSSSMLLSADDLATGEINKQSDTWIKPGHSFAVPISITTPNTVVNWEFTVHPKDIEFSILYRPDGHQPLSQAIVLVPPARCSSLKDTIQGELTARTAGVYTLVFDNSYSRMTSKKIHYSLNYSS